MVTSELRIKFVKQGSHTFWWKSLMIIMTMIYHDDLWTSLSVFWYLQLQPLRLPHCVVVVQYWIWNVWNEFGGILRCSWWQFLQLHWRMHPHDCPFHSLLFGAPSLVEPGCYPGQILNPMKHSESKRKKPKVAQEFLCVRLCWMIMVLWFCFFSSWFDLGVKHGKIKHRISEIFSYQCQGHALVSVKAIGFPVFLKENISQIQLVIAQGKHTNIDPEKLVLYQASKSEKRILIFFQLYLGFPWGWILPPSLETPELKEFIFEKAKHSESKRKCQSSSRVFVCQIVLDDHGFVVLFFFPVDSI